MAGPSPADVLGRVTLVTGKEEFLNERTVLAVRDAVRRHDGEAEFARPAAETSRSRRWVSWPRRRCSRARAAWWSAALEDLPEESVDGPAGLRRRRRPRTSRWCSSTAAAQKGSGVLNKLRKLGRVTESKSGELRPSEFPGFVAAEVRRHGAEHRPGGCGRARPGRGPGPALAVRSGPPADQRLPGRAAHRRQGQAVLRWSGRGEVVRRGRRGVLRPPGGGPRGAALGAGRRHAAGPGHERVRRRCPGPGPLQGRSAGDARGRPGPRGGRAAVEAAHPPRPVPRLVGRRRSPARSGRSPRPTPTSRAPRAMRRTPSSAWCSPSPRAPR